MSDPRSWSPPEEDPEAADRGPPLLFERLRGWGAWIAVLVTVLFVVTQMPPAGRLPVALLCLVAILVLRGRSRRSSSEDRYGPGA